MPLDLMALLKGPKPPTPRAPTIKYAQAMGHRPALPKTNQIRKVTGVSAPSYSNDLEMSIDFLLTPEQREIMAYKKTKKKPPVANFGAKF